MISFLVCVHQSRWSLRPCENWAVVLDPRRTQYIVAVKRWSAWILVWVRRVSYIFVYQLPNNKQLLQTHCSALQCHEQYYSPWQKATLKLHGLLIKVSNQPVFYPQQLSGRQNYTPHLKLKLFLTTQCWIFFYIRTGFCIVHWAMDAVGGSTVKEGTTCTHSTAGSALKSPCSPALRSRSWPFLLAPASTIGSCDGT